MKKLFVILFAATGMMACKSKDKSAEKLEVVGYHKADSDPVVSSGPVDTTNFTSIQWLDSTYLDLGKQKEGKEIEITFRFKNTGSKNLVFEDVHAGCGCTIPERPDKPYAPGDEGLIKAKFSGAGHGETRKQVYIKANIQPDGLDTLTFRTELIKD